MSLVVRFIGRNQTKLPTEEIRQVYLYLLAHKGDYQMKDIFGKSSIHYMEKYSWGNSLFNIIKE